MQRMRVPSKVLVQLLDKPIDPRVVLCGGTLDNFADRMASCRRQIFQMSALSTLMLV
jgi:hypothetical protein